MAIDKITTPAIADDAVTNAKVSYNNNQFRNIIINGDMSLAQRGTSASSQTTSAYLLDRWKYAIASQGTWTMSQSTDVPTGQGFVKSFKADCTTADASPAASDKVNFQTRFEGQNLQYLKKGTANAESLTASFWVKSNKTGTYICELQELDNDRAISSVYTISSANTWEKKTITFPGDTTGTIDNDNARSLDIIWYLGSGSDLTSGTLQTSWGSKVNANRAVGQVNLADSTSNEWYITGVQLEAGSVASDFEFLPVDVNLRRCERYFEKSYDISVTPGTVDFSSTITVPPNTGDRHQGVYFKTRKRASATIVIYSPASGASGAIKEDSTNPSASVPDSGETSFRMSVSGGVGTGADAAMHFTAEAEL